jgi:hypothetical protein
MGSRRKLLAVGTGSVVLAAAFMVRAVNLSSSASASAPAASPAIYYVDGAKPSAKGVVTDDYAECVQWSADRLDVHICGDVPSGYAPPPAPYFDGPICSAAKRWLDAKRAAMTAGGTSDSEINATYPVEDPSSCLVQQQASGPIWMVLFKASPPDQPNIHVPYAPQGGVSWAAHT